MTIKGSCHCGKVAFEIDGEIPEKLTSCTCSFCSKRGMLYAYYAPEKLTVTTDNGDAIYRWKSKMVEHHFCKECGSGVYANSPNFKPDGTWDGKSRRIGANARLFDDFVAAKQPVTEIDGKNLW